MARPLRIDYAGGWYQLTSRGNERGRIYRDDSDRAHFLELLEELGAEGVSRKDAKTQRWEEDERGFFMVGPNTLHLGVLSAAGVRLMGCGAHRGHPFHDEIGAAIREGCFEAGLGWFA